ncbi:MAG: crossover junction endodeoxyribonuclease RuvC [Acidimicrobiales bacterium]
MFVLGVDPGLVRCGYAILNRSDEGIAVETAGLIETPRDLPLSVRLLEIFDLLREVMQLCALSVVVVERVLFQSNVRTAMSVGQASGAALMAAAACSLPVVQMSSNEVKLALVGDGGASKLQLQTMVQRLLLLDQLPGPPDVVDAIGLAYCYLSVAPHQRELWPVT